MLEVEALAIELRGRGGSGEDRTPDVRLSPTILEIATLPLSYGAIRLILLNIFSWSTK